MTEPAPIYIIASWPLPDPIVVDGVWEFVDSTDEVEPATIVARWVNRGLWDRELVIMMTESE